MAVGTLSRNVNSGNDLMYLPGQAPPKVSPLQNQYQLYNEAVGQQAGDYDSIMEGFKNALSSIRNNPVTQITPQTAAYQRSPDVTSALGIQKNLAETGGYTDEGIRDLRARGISPIRSVYANANRDIDRNKSLNGGFSPNYTAAKTKMAREMSEKIATQVQDVNAGLAQNVASNKLQAAPAYASTAMGESTLNNNMNSQNADRINAANVFNANAADKGNADQLAALQGMTSLYGTTPALSRLFGDQAQASTNTQLASKQAAQQNAYGALNTIGRRVAGA